MPYEWAAYGIASNASAPAAAAKTQRNGKPVGAAALLTLALFIVIPQERHS